MPRSSARPSPHTTPKLVAEPIPEAAAAAAVRQVPSGTPRRSANGPRTTATSSATAVVSRLKSSKPMRLRRNKGYVRPKTEMRPEGSANSIAGPSGLSRSVEWRILELDSGSSELNQRCEPSTDNGQEMDGEKGCESGLRRIWQ